MMWNAIAMFWLAASLILLSGCVRQESLPEIAEVPSFVMTAQTGEEFRSESLQNKIWIADFIFTMCPGPCPRMSTEMSRIQDRLKNEPDVRLVSFTVDPEHDTPQVLAGYAKRYGADANRWHFLNGPASLIQKLDQAAFKLGHEGMIHSTRFVLVDGNRIRGYYDSADPESLDRLINDAKRLLREQP